MRFRSWKRRVALSPRTDEVRYQLASGAGYDCIANVKIGSGIEEWKQWGTSTEECAKLMWYRLLSRWSDA